MARFWRELVGHMICLHAGTCITIHFVKIAVACLIFGTCTINRFPSSHPLSPSPLPLSLHSFISPFLPLPIHLPQSLLSFLPHSSRDHLFQTLLSWRCRLRELSSCLWETLLPLTLVITVKSLDLRWAQPASFKLITRQLLTDLKCILIYILTNIKFYAIAGHLSIIICN